VPLSVSEYLMTRWEYLPILESEAADVIRIDSTRAGGFTESRKIATLVDTFGLPVTMHDCTGPFTMLAGLAIAATNPNAMYQEVVRAYLHHIYPLWVDYVLTVHDETVPVPQRVGLGANLDPAPSERPGCHARRTHIDR
jgi:galactonate dehydratase